MNYFFITGTSRGIGNAIATQLLANPKNQVTGLSRTNSISHERFSFVEMDLSDETSVKNWNFPELKNAEKICLVNNAGIIGAIYHAGKLEADDIAKAYQVNLVAPTVLTNSFLKKYSSISVKQIIINVSSGAGKNPIDGWSVYCATKAGLDMFTRTLAEELKIADKKHIYAFAVAPGVVDTSMQEEIRKSSSNDFSRIQTFIDYKNSHQLANPILIAEKYLSILELPEQFKDVIFSVKDI
ncbi:MAG: SDR family NAD(P)-dependent oxidoreductase [Bacteroidetes bacterium]|nr:SDR family NAD(P)-dependent oxidoreductase [Bacteroidota bacterium]